MKSFKEFISEASFIGKGFALLQRSQFMKRKFALRDHGQRIEELGKEALRETDTIRKLDRIAESQIQIGAAFQVIAEISNNLIDTSVTSVLDSKDVTKAVKDALKTR